MKTVGHKLEKFAITGVKPGQPEDAFFTITDESFAGKWKVIVYYPKDFTFVCPTEIVAYDKHGFSLSGNHVVKSKRFFATRRRAKTSPIQDRYGPLE